MIRANAYPNSPDGTDAEFMPDLLITNGILKSHMNRKVLLHFRGEVVVKSVLFTRLVAVWLALTVIEKLIFLSGAYQFPSQDQMGRKVFPTSIQSLHPQEILQ